MWWSFLNIRSGSWSVKIHARGGGRFSQAGQARRVAPLLAPTTSTQVHPLQLCCKGEREKKSQDKAGMIVKVHGLAGPTILG